MKARSACALALAAALGACAFWSDKPLFSADEAAAPIADGAQFGWFENERQEQVVVYRRAGAGYAVVPVDEDEEPMQVMFVPVSATPEEDYIAQAVTRPDETSRFYAFMWRTDVGYRLLSAPSAAANNALGEAALAKHCAARPSGECRFARAEDVIAFYLEAIHPAFVVAGETPSDYIDQIPVAGAPEGQ